MAQGSEAKLELGIVVLPLSLIPGFTARNVQNSGTAPPLNNEVLIANLSGRGTVDQKEVEMSTENLVQRCPQVPPNPASPPRRGSGNQERRLHKPPVRSMQQQSSGRGRGHWDQEEIRRRPLSPSDFPWGEGKSSPTTGGVTGRRIIEEPSSISNGQGPIAEKPIPATAGRNISGGTQGRSGKSGSNKGEYQLCRRVGHPKVETGVAPANLANQAGAASASPACLSLAQEPHLPQGPSGPFIFTAVTTAPRGHIGYRDP